MSDVILGRLRSCLIDALERAGYDTDRPVKVAAIYQDLIPYGAVRSELGVELNADYEHALLRLLAGEGGTLRVEQTEAREALRREVAEPYPFVGLYRKYASCDVRIESMERPDVPPAAGREAPHAPPGGEASPQETGPEIGTPAEWLLDDEPEPAAGAGSERELAEETGPEAAAAPSPERTEAAPAATERCPHCQGALPRGREVRFCPRCGADQRALACPACSEPVDPDWRFCIACGTSVAGDAGPER